MIREIGKVVNTLHYLGLDLLKQDNFMAFVASELFRQDFTSVSSVTVTHNLGIEYPAVRVIIDGNFRPDLLHLVMVDEADPLNKLIVELTSSQTGTIQVLDYDFQAVGIASASRQHQTFTHGQSYTYNESLAAQTNGTATYAQALRVTTPSVEAGDYLASWSFTWNINRTSRSFRARIEQDDTTSLWAMYQEPKDGSTLQEHPASGLAQVTLTAGVHTFDLDYANSGNGTARITNARMTFYRVT